MTQLLKSFVKFVSLNKTYTFINNTKSTLRLELKTDHDHLGVVDIEGDGDKYTKTLSTFATLYVKCGKDQKWYALSRETQTIHLAAFGLKVY